MRDGSARRSPAGTEFRPARPHRAFIHAMRLLNRFYAMPRARLDCELHGAAILRDLPPGVILTANHSDHADALVVTEVLRRTGRIAAFMATRETFDGRHGLNGLVLQWMGGFSVNRGGENGPCRQFAKDLLTRSQYDLLIFPEGEIYLLNDLVMPFKPGVAMLALEVADEQRKNGRSERPVAIVPVAIKYRYLEDVAPALDRIAGRLEIAYFGEPRSGPLYDRIYAIGVELLGRRESELGLRLDPTWDVYDRVHHIQKYLLESLERRYFGRVRDDFPFDRARRLILHLLEELDRLRDQTNLPDGERAARTADLKRDLRRAEAAARSVSFADDYVVSRPTQERMAETLTKLEREILGRAVPLPRVKRSADVRIGQPIDARTYLPGYEIRGARKESILRLTADLQGCIQTMIDAANAAAGGAAGLPGTPS